jgi:MscS family membrane protein
MKEWFDFWSQQQILHNSILNYLLFLGILLAGWLLKGFFSRFLSKQLFILIRRNAESIPLTSFVRLMRRPIEAIFSLVFLYLALDRLSIPAEWQWAPAHQFGFRLIANRTFETLIMGSITWGIVRFIKFLSLIFLKRAEKTESKLDDQLIPFFRDLIVVAVVLLSALVVLDNVFSIDVAALLAGLGIGGLALALAARETLENLFASFTIFLDLPFVVGDAVQVGATSGDVEKVGFRSTRIRTADGSIVTIPNRLMTSQALDNQTQREYRRAKFTLRLTYQTTEAQLRHLTTSIQALIDAHPLTANKKGLVKFENFGESSLDLLVIFHVETTDWRVFNDVKEELNFGILRMIEQSGTTLAYPTTTVHWPDYPKPNE